MNKDDLQDINSISLDIKKFCDMILCKEGDSEKIIREIQDCASTIIQIISDVSALSRYNEVED
jgi:hypothetical protein